MTAGLSPDSGSSWFFLMTAFLLLLLTSHTCTAPCDFLD